jgi:hypothetical protein
LEPTLPVSCSTAEAALAKVAGMDNPALTVHLPGHHLTTTGLVSRVLGGRVTRVDDTWTYRGGTAVSFFEEGELADQAASQRSL